MPVHRTHGLRGFALQPAPGREASRSLGRPLGPARARLRPGVPEWSVAGRRPRVGRVSGRAVRRRAPYLTASRGRKKRRARPWPSTVEVGATITRRLRTRSGRASPAMKRTAEAERWHPASGPRAAASAASRAPPRHHGRGDGRASDAGAGPHGGGTEAFETHRAPAWACRTGPLAPASFLASGRPGVSSTRPSIPVVVRPCRIIEDEAARCRVRCRHGRGKVAAVWPNKTFLLSSVTVGPVR